MTDARLQISDRKNNLLTVQLDTALAHWMPETPGKIRSSSDWNKNRYDSVPTSSDNSFFDIVCYTDDSTGARVLVTRFNGAYTNTPFRSRLLASGMGFIYASGNLTMADGITTWKNLDATTSDSMDSDSDSAVAASDDSSDGGDSADA
jgi:hypothetical protein